MDRFTQTLARLTSDLEDIYVAIDGEPAVAPVLELQFDTTSSTVTETEPAANGRKFERQCRTEAFPNAIKPWNNTDNTDLIAGVRFGLTDEAIAEFLGRTAEAVSKQRLRLGIKRTV